MRAVARHGCGEPPCRAGFVRQVREVFIRLKPFPQRDHGQHAVALDSSRLTFENFVHREDGRVSQTSLALRSEYSERFFSKIVTERLEVFELWNVRIGIRPEIDIRQRASYTVPCFRAGQLLVQSCLDIILMFGYARIFFKGLA